MGSSREASPDWLRSFKVHNQSAVTLLSSSCSSSSNNPSEDDDDCHEVQALNESQDRKQNEDLAMHDVERESPTNKAPKAKPSKNKNKSGNDAFGKGFSNEKEAVEADALEKQTTESHVSSRLPLMFPDKVQRSKVLIECEGDSIDMSGDVGAVGRVSISDGSNGSHEMLLDLKGTIYKTKIVPARTFCVVSFGQTEAKVEAIMNDFIQLKPHSNVYEAETMIEGTLDGFSFDMEEGDQMPKISAHQSNNKDETDEPTDPQDSKSNGKAEKPSMKDKVQKKSKKAKKPPKIGGRKATVSKGKRSKK